MAACSLRPSVLCGPGDDRQGEPPFIVGDGQNLWDVIYVTNVADAHVLAAENPVSSMTVASDIFFIQNNEPITFRDFCLAIWAHFGHTPPFEIHTPEKLAYLVVLICGFLTWVFGTTTTLRCGSARDVCSVRYANGEKAKLVLGYRPRVVIETGIRLSCEDYARRMGIESHMQ
ncbi:NAD dependent epimerase/dehydratase [Aspergillus arachidicola]|uniref:NAD dependent epimerase/dehydratase n=1 Tax=Aspergillus arachidicola TaxID=656916 RepID=A0A2G7FUI4_9EURO|nr:NAD dependent epimerase/dehydratase [Aspergillus arachidicola]